MIPKIIHYCWLSGDPMPELNLRCLATWKEKLPDYEIMLWDASCLKQIDLNWTYQAYEKRKWAFAADCIRFYALWHYGGIYLDADVEVLQSFNSLLGKKYFIGTEITSIPEAAVIGAEPHLNWIKNCLDYYSDRNFVNPDGSLNQTVLPVLMKSVIESNSIELLPYYYFSPKDFFSGKIMKRNETICIHHFDSNWVDKNSWWFKVRAFIHKYLFLLLGREGHNNIVNAIRRFTI